MPRSAERILCRDWINAWWRRTEQLTFRVLQERPVLGRPLVEADEQAGAPWVVLIGHDVWQSRFDSDPNAIGRELRLANVPHTIVGVMPEGFRFPLAHSFWVPRLLIVMQVAVMAIVPTPVIAIHGDVVRWARAANAGLVPAQYLAVTMAMDREEVPGAAGSTFTGRFAAATQELAGC
jgi:hypothetical protein